VPRLGVIGHLARDVVAGSPPRIGGGTWHGPSALRLIGAEATVVAKCGEADSPTFRAQLEGLGFPFALRIGGETTAFSFSYDTRGARTMAIEAVGEPFRVDELDLGDAEWLHVAPLLRGEIDVSPLAPGRRILLDAHGLVRRPRVGPLRLDGGFDRTLLEHVSMLKLADEEAAVVGPVDVPELIVTHGMRGATINGEHVPAEPVDGDPTGAGDAFAAGYLAARSEGAAPVEAARSASALVAAYLTR
jgi:sugar/nucleoside kinase (ribokinase family)